MLYQYLIKISTLAERNIKDISMCCVFYKTIAIVSFSLNKITKWNEHLIHFVNKETETVINCLLREMSCLYVILTVTKANMIKMAIRYHVNND